MVEFRLQFDAPPTSVTTPVGRIAPGETQNAPAPAEPDNSQALQTVQALLGKVNEIERTTRQRMDEWNNHLIGLATQIAQAIVRFDDDFVQERVCQYMAAAVDQLPGGNPGAVIVHPSCAATIRDWIEKSQANQSLNGAIVVREDPSVAPGDCVVENDAGSVAAMMDAHLEAIAQRFNEQVPQQRR